ncbi:MAG TPA: hypothetical protein VN747_04270, partial [Burkholderiales bacterium]|nr:hypothetical protein [Burkholderiales bacterium]
GFGFTGALVPGVDVYAYMMHLPVARWGREFLEKYKDGKVLVLDTHFASPTSGRILRDGAGFRFEA